jgi:RluA family pseudouridine synthase
VVCLLAGAAGFWPSPGTAQPPRAPAEDAFAHRQVSRLLEGEARRRNWPARGYLVDARPPGGITAARVGPSLWFVPFRPAPDGLDLKPLAPPHEVVAAALDSVEDGYECAAPQRLLRRLAGSQLPEIYAVVRQGWDDEYRTTLDEPCTAAKAMRRAGFSRGLMRTVMRSGYILSDGNPVTADVPLAAGVRLRVLAPAGPPSSVGPEPGKLDLVYEDDDILVVNKPAGLLIHPGRQAGEPTLAGLAAGRFARQGRPSTPRAIGRLDRGTSGLVVFARTRFAQEALARAWHGGQASKEYLALTAPDGAEHRPGQGFVETRPIQSPPFDRNRYREPRAARTAFRVLRGWAPGALVAASPETGRTHQVRQHLAAAGMPLYGDRIYGGPPGAIGRPALHLWRLRFGHPVTGEHLSLRAPLPEDMRRLVSRFRQHVVSTGCGPGGEVSPRA